MRPFHTISLALVAVILVSTYFVLLEKLSPVPKKLEFDSSLLPKLHQKSARTVNEPTLDADKLIGLIAQDSDKQADDSQPMPSTNVNSHMTDISPQRVPLKSFILRPMIWKQAIKSFGEASIVSAPHLVNNKGMLVIEMYGYVPTNVSLELWCNFPNVPNAKDSLNSASSEVTPNKARLVRHPHSPTTNQGNAAGKNHLINAYCDAPPSLWLNARQQGSLFLQITGMWEFEPVEFIVPPDERIKATEAPLHRPLVYCSGPIYFNPSPNGFHYLFQRLIEFIEYHHAIGVSHFFMYMQRLPNDELGQREMAHYAQRGLVTWIDYTTTPQGLYYHGQMIAMTDCLLRNKRTAQYGLFMDFDEFLFFPKEINITTQGLRPNFLLEKVQKEDKILQNHLGYMVIEPWNFATYVCGDEREQQSFIKPHRGLILPEYRWKVSRGSWDAVKYIARLDSASWISVHLAGLDDCEPNTSCPVIRVPADEIIKYHYKFGAMSEPIKCRMFLSDPSTVFNKVFDRYDRPHTLVWDTSLSYAWRDKMEPLVKAVWEAVYQKNSSIFIEQFGSN